MMILNLLSKYKTTLGVFISILLIIATIPSQRRIESIRGEFDIIQKSLFLSSSTLKRMSLGYNLLVADIYWIRALQFFSDTGSYLDKGEELFKYFDIMTDLDPKFVNAYRFGGTFLAEPPTLGLGEIELGIKLLDKGRLNNPQNFRLVLDEAFIYYLYTDDFNKASELFTEASEKDSLSEFRSASIKGMAALALSKTGNLELSKKIWTYIYKTSSLEGRKNHALNNLKEIETKQFENELTNALKSYYNDQKRLPSDVQGLVKLGYVNRIPEDPSGGKFQIISDSKRIVSSELAKKEYKFAVGLLNARSQKFKRYYGRYAKDMNELKEFVDKSPLHKFPENPYGRAFVYDSSAGRVK